MRPGKGAMRDRWNELCRGLGAGSDTHAWYDVLEAMYAFPARHYHDLSHVRECLDQFDTVRDGLPNAGQVEFAIWFHDCVYVPGRPDNEERSAGVARIAAASMGLDELWRERVTELILATRHAEPPRSHDGAILVDIDMSILAAPADRYARYAAAIRREFSFASDEQFAAGRGAFLKGLLSKGSIFHSEALAARLEAPARRNIAGELSRLAV